MVRLVPSHPVKHFTILDLCTALHQDYPAIFLHTHQTYDGLRINSIQRKFLQTIKYYDDSHINHKNITFCLHHVEITRLSITKQITTHLVIKYKS